MKQNILLTDLDKIIIFELDKEAKDKSISRNELIRQILSSHIKYPELQELENNYIDIINKCLIVIERNSNLIDTIMKGVNENE